MQSPFKPDKIRIDKLGVISVQVDTLSQQYNDLHNRLLNDWKSKIVDKIQQTKQQIQTLLSSLQTLYEQHSSDQRSTYVQLLIIKLKKAISNQTEINSIMNQKSMNTSNITTSKFQSSFEKQIKNKNQKEKEKQKQKEKEKEKQLKSIGNKVQKVTKIAVTPQKVNTYSPFRSKGIVAKDKVKVVVNKLEIERNGQKQNKYSAENRGNRKVNCYQEEMDNTQKLENLMLTIKMTKEEYFEYMKDI